MPLKRGGAGADNSKKAQGQARKAEAANSKKVAKDREVQAEEESTWKEGSKDSSRKEAAAAKAAEAARKKAERAALEAEEMASLKTAKTGNAKSAQKKKDTTPSRGLDLAQLDAPEASATNKKGPALNATGIENALDALDITAGSSDAVDRHPERRFKAAFAAFEARRLDEMKDEKGLRRNQKIEAIRKEFEKSEENPFNQVNASFNTSRDEIRELRKTEKEKTEKRLVGQSSV